MANQAAFVDKKGDSINIREAPYPISKPGYVIVKNAAVALNPIDWKLQSFGFLIRSWPTVLGSDVAGEVVEVGDGVDNVKVGDRVVGHAFALATGDNAEAAFQLFTLVPAEMLTRLPDSMSFETAAVLPLSVSCAAAALFEKNALALPLPPSINDADKQSILIWGGSSSVGSSAIQLARASGLRVITTASPRNGDYVKGLGASEVFDRADSAIVAKLTEALKETKCVGAFDAVGMNIGECAEVLATLGGGHVVATGDPPKDLPADVTANHVFATSIKDNEIGKAIYGHHLPAFLADGTFKPAPSPTVVGHGLESLQGGLDRLKKGVSATKLVVSLLIDSGVWEGGTGREVTGLRSKHSPAAIVVLVVSSPAVACAFHQDSVLLPVPLGNTNPLLRQALVSRIPSFVTGRTLLLRPALTHTVLPRYISIDVQYGSGVFRIVVSYMQVGGANCRLPFPVFAISTVERHDDVVLGVLIFNLQALIIAVQW